MKRCIVTSYLANLTPDRQSQGEERKVAEALLSYTVAQVGYNHVTSRGVLSCPVFFPRKVGKDIMPSLSFETVFGVVLEIPVAILRASPYPRAIDRMGPFLRWISPRFGFHSPLRLGEKRAES